MYHFASADGPENDDVLGNATRTHGSNPARFSQRDGLRWPRRDFRPTELLLLSPDVSRGLLETDTVQLVDG